MPAATTKADLVAITEKEFAKLSKLIAAVPVDLALQKDSDGTSIKDVIAHRAHWIDLFLGWYDDGRAGRPVYFPAQGYKWNDLKRYNADLRAAQAGIGFSASLEMLNASYENLIAFIDRHTEAELYETKLIGSNDTWMVGRWAEAAGASHFRSAVKCIRATMRKLQ